MSTFFSRSGGSPPTDSKCQGSSMVERPANQQEDGGSIPTPSLQIRKMRRPNKVNHCPNGTSILTLERRDGSTLECVIDTTDYSTVKEYRWCAHRSRHTFYAVAYVNGKTKELHSLLLFVERVDHIDRNGLNNRRNNLRPSNSAQNTANSQKRQNKITSTFRGVRKTKARHFEARIKIRGRHISLGTFASEEKAARAYDDAAKKYFGEFAYLNFGSGTAA
jgi:hypothetical protein